MTKESDNLQALKDSLVAAIHRAFDGVQLVGGVSWQQAEAADMQPPPDDAKWSGSNHARQPWTTLVDDREWAPFPGVGGFAFIDAKGFRFYLPPTMIRMLRRNDELFPGQFREALSRAVWHEPKPLLTEEQCRCIASFLKIMADAEADKVREWALANPWHPVDYKPEPWQAALDSFWNRYLSP